MAMKMFPEKTLNFIKVIFSLFRCEKKTKKSKATKSQEILVSSPIQHFFTVYDGFRVFGCFSLLFSLSNDPIKDVRRAGINIDDDDDAMHKESPCSSTVELKSSTEWFRLCADIRSIFSVRQFLHIFIAEEQRESD